MFGIYVWISIIGPVIAVVGITIEHIYHKRNIKQNLKIQKNLSDLIKNQGKQLKSINKQIAELSKGMPKNDILEREKFELKKREQEAKEKRQQLNAIFKTIKLFKDLGD